jgi:site-specific recombinase XerD
MNQLVTSPLLSKPSEFSALIQRFFVERLIQQRNASPRTIAAYRDTFRLLLSYIKQQRHKTPTVLTLNDFNTNMVLGFLDHLESQRHNSIRSRNARLAALRSFAQYVALQCPPALNLVQQILAIPMKRFEKPLLGFLTRDEVRAILMAPDANSWCGQRDRILLSVLYNSGARVSELIGIRVVDVTINGSACVRLHGKGRKQRTVPLWKETAAQIRQWIQYGSLQAEQSLIPNRHGQSMTRSNVSERIALAVDVAIIGGCSQLKGRQISPHTFRHTTAMHLLQSGVDITVIALWLGHENPITTHGYVEADLTMKKRALASINPPKTKKTRYCPSDSLLKFLEGL